MQGKQIKNIRKENSLTQEEFGKKLNHTKSTVSKWENGSASPSIQTLKRISEVFDIDLKTLLDDVQSKPKQAPPKKAHLKWDKVNYSGIKDIPKKKQTLFTIIWSTLLVIGIGLFIPLIIYRDAVGVNWPVYMVMAGTFILVADVIYVGVVWRKGLRVAYDNRMNVSGEFFSNKISLTNKLSGKSKDFLADEVVSVSSDGRFDLIKGEVEVTLVNHKKIKLFEVDQSVLNIITRYVKGGKYE